MGLPPRRDPGGPAGGHIGRAEIAVVSQHGLGLAQILGQSGEHFSVLEDPRCAETLCPCAAGSAHFIEFDHHCVARVGLEQ
jgi:hypothetical protein